MHILKRLSLFLLLGAAGESLHSTPADQQPSAPATQPAAQVSGAPGTSGLDADKEKQARDLLHSVLSGDSERPKVGASPPELERRKELRDQALNEVRRSAGVPTNAVSSSAPDAATLNAEREKEIARIEAEVEAARKRRAQAAGAKANSSQPANSSVSSAPANSSTAPAPAVATQTPSAAARTTTSVGSVRPAVVVAGPDGSTLTPEAEKKARDLLKENTIIIYSDNPAPPVRLAAAPSSAPPQPGSL